MERKPSSTTCSESGPYLSRPSLYSMFATQPPTLLGMWNFLMVFQALSHSRYSVSLLVLTYSISSLQAMLPTAFPKSSSSVCYQKDPELKRVGRGSKGNGQSTRPVENKGLRTDIYIFLILWHNSLPSPWLVKLVKNFPTTLGIPQIFHRTIQFEN